MTASTTRAGAAGASQGLPTEHPHIERRPGVCGGRPCIRGTRIWVSLILDMLAEGMSASDLRAEYPVLTHEDILSAIAYGAEAARDRIIPVPAA